MLLSLKFVSVGEFVVGEIIVRLFLLVIVVICSVMEEFRVFIRVRTFVFCVRLIAVCRFVFGVL